MKKIIAAVLVIALVMSIATVAFAEDSEVVAEFSEAVETPVETAEEITEETETEEVAEVEEVAEPTEEVAEPDEETEAVEETAEEPAETETAEEITEETETEEVAEVEEVLPVIATAYATISSNHKNEAVEEGTEIILTANTDGIEGNILSICWQYTADNGATIHTAAESGNTFTFYASAENVNYLWRAVVTYEVVETVETAEAAEITETEIAA